MENLNGYKRAGVQKLRAGRFVTSTFTSSNVGDGQKKTFENLEIRILDNSNSKYVSGKRKRWRRSQRRRRRGRRKR